MDTGSKTLAQLSEENKETKYVSLDTASHISGYTKDYLERLCRLNKVTYMLGPNGAFVIELESLLKETQAILLSYEGVTFVEKSELTEPVAQMGMENTMLSSASREVDTRVASLTGEKDMDHAPHRVFTERATREIPHFALSENEEATGTPFSFVGRAVVSGVESQPVKQQKAMPNAAVSQAIPEPSKTVEQRLPEKLQEKPQEKLQENKIEIPSEKTIIPTIQSVVPPQEVKPMQVVVPNAEPIALPAATILPTAMHIKVMTEQKTESGAKTTPVILGAQVVLAPFEKISAPELMKEKPRGNIGVPHAPTKVKVIGDNWDEALLGNETVNCATHVQIKDDKPNITSPYRPIQTSIDREAHDDPAPLFPVIEKKAQVPVIDAIVVEEPKVVLRASTESETVSTLASVGEQPSVVQKTVVFDPASAVAGASSQKIVPSSVVMSNRIAAVDSVIGVDAIPMRGIPVAAVEREDRVPSKPALAAIPMHEEEHHLSIHEYHPLMKSSGFNAVFAVMLLGASFLMIGGTYLQSAGSSLNSATYVAGVGAALDNASLHNAAATATPASRFKEVGTPVSGGVLPFSNDIIATSGEKTNTVIVQPVSRDGSAGKAYEFMVVPVAK